MSELIPVSKSYTEAYYMANKAWFNEVDRIFETNSPEPMIDINMIEIDHKTLKPINGGCNEKGEVI